MRTGRALRTNLRTLRTAGVRAHLVQPLQQSLELVQPLARVAAPLARALVRVRVRARVRVRGRGRGRVRVRSRSRGRGRVRGRGRGMARGRGRGRGRVLELRAAPPSCRACARRDAPHPAWHICIWHEARPRSGEARAWRVRHTRMHMHMTCACTCTCCM